MRICVFCGSSTGRGDRYVTAARELGTSLARRGIGLVYGGASVGTMGEVANAALDAGGKVTGVIPGQLVERELAHNGVTDLRVVSDMHERKALMAELADGFIALPGGIGTLEELFEVWTWGHLGLHRKPLALLDIEGFYQPLRAFVSHMVGEEFLPTESLDMLLFDSDPASLLERIGHYFPPAPRGEVPDPSVESAARTPSTLDVLAWVHVRHGRMLAARTEGSDLFYLPGGKRQGGESDVAAVVREVKEETSVRLRPESVVPFTVVHEDAHGYPDGTRVRLACFTAEGDGEPTERGEIAELAWLSHAERARCAPGVRLVMDQLAQRGLLE
ncbi:TIGR00730 family Rossman fold protein [Halostreptopolyspora alba]|uniref:TIGR00730 family Rossman fold protein n=1 Tax=Halostreptopolyspora alba TaxID=2487137 RepID=UPI00371341C8